MSRCNLYCYRRKLFCLDAIYFVTLQKVEQLIKAGGAFAEYASHAIEKIIWDKENYLEENTFSTGHQMVNVYRKPERYYEIRSDESAIDVQIHGVQ